MQTTGLLADGNDVLRDCPHLDMCRSGDEGTADADADAVLLDQCVLFVRTGYAPQQLAGRLNTTKSVQNLCTNQEAVSTLYTGP